MKRYFIGAFLLTVFSLSAMEKNNYGSTEQQPVKKDLIPKEESDLNEHEIIISEKPDNKQDKQEKEFNLATLQPSEMNQPLNYQNMLTKEQYLKLVLKNRGYKFGGTKKKTKKGKGFFGRQKRSHQPNSYISSVFPSNTSNQMEWDKQLNGLDNNGLLTLLQLMNNSIQETLEDRTSNLKDGIDTVQKKQQSTFRDWIHEGTGAVRSVVTIVALGATIFLMKKLGVM